MLKAIWGSALVVVACLAAGAAALAEEGVPLGFHFAAGEVREYEISFFGSGSLRPEEGELVVMALRGSGLLCWRVSEALPDGSGRLQVTVPRAEMEITVGEQEVFLSYGDEKLRWYANGREHAPPEMAFDQLPLLGRPVELTIAPNGRVSELSLGDPQALRALGWVLPQGSVSSVGGFGSQVFPDRPVRVGESWSYSGQLLPFGPGMPVMASSQHTLVSFSEEGGVGVAKVLGYSEVRFSMAPIAVSSGEREMTVSASEVRRTVTSTEFFDTSQGRLVRGDYQVSLLSRFTVRIGGEERKGEVEGRIQLTAQGR